MDQDKQWAPHILLRFLCKSSSAAPMIWRKRKVYNQLLLLHHKEITGFSARNKKSVGHYAVPVPILSETFEEWDDIFDNTHL